MALVQLLYNLLVIYNNHFNALLDDTFFFGIFLQLLSYILVTEIAHTPPYMYVTVTALKVKKDWVVQYDIQIKFSNSFRLSFNQDLLSFTYIYFTSFL